MPTELNLDGLRESEERFRATFDQAAIGIAHLAEDGTWLQVNPRLCEMLGYTREEMLRLSCHDQTPSVHLDQDMIAVRNLLTGRERTQILEKRYFRKNGTLVWAEVTVSVVQPPLKARYFLAIIEDISQRKLTEEAAHLTHSELEKRVEQRTRELTLSNSFLMLEMRERERAQLERDRFFELSLDIMAISDMNGYYRRVNPAFCQLLGYSATELTNRSFKDLVHPDDITLADAKRQLIVKTAGEFRNFEVRFISKSGTIKWLSWSGRSYPTFGLNYITARDMTEVKQREAQEQQIQATLATNNKLNAIGLMATNIAHEINNPLTIIYGESCMLRKISELDVLDPAKVARIAKNVVQMSERIMNIINGLRALARDGNCDPMEAVPLRRILDETIPFCRGKIMTENILFKLEDVGPDIYLCCRAVQLSQVLLNLLNNAFDAVMGRRDERRIEVFTVTSATQLRICVRDNGPGIDPQVKPRLFEPFVTSKPVGQGLGLNVSRGMIEANGGELFLDPAARETTFVICMPRVMSS